MRKIAVFLLITAFTFVFTPSQAGAQHKYVGVGKCKTCHKSKRSGQQYQIWQKSKHSKAYATLSSAESKKIAKEKGLGDPQKAPQCLKCHITAYNADKNLLGKRYKMEDGVGCESCHGPGGDYYKKKVMKAIYEGKQDGKAVGLIKPDEKTCKKCHNEESPSYKPFDFKKRIKEIAHPVLKK